MHIDLSPQHRDASLTVEKQGDILTINGAPYDFSSIPEGATVENVPCDFIVGPVSRINGEIHLTLISPHGGYPTETEAFPPALEVAPDGVIIDFNPAAKGGEDVEP
ncbi:hypothetical protein NA8A_04110 [Nitratireductor indicus C115]|uniref:Uncharacterized protein n=1 Tax=Nitratireductor indicus C115 TaxID=1231190 RepID=K2P1C3_9HYPH|nr:hypothetical protein [Nitratireductor indicus]EKF43964.1 hypothetical protein NA8A_04110 [Nitratireductor indicus C115]SFQ13206.1 hypothetical protein SAMN05216176_101493 [Nitratireductor indicus]